MSLQEALLQYFAGLQRRVIATVQEAQRAA